MTVRELATRARVAPSTVTNVEAGRRASLDTYARLAVALGRSLELELGSERRSRVQEPSDVVHAAMGELEASWLDRHRYDMALDQPYQHYQFAGRADLVAWTRQPPRLLHVENRTRFPDLQAMAGSYNAKRQYLGRVLARDLRFRSFDSETHVIVALWSAEVIHAIRRRPASFRVLCPIPLITSSTGAPGDRPTPAPAAPWSCSIHSPEGGKRGWSTSSGPSAGSGLGSATTAMRPGVSKAPESVTIRRAARRGRGARGEDDRRPPSAVPAEL